MSKKKAFTLIEILVVVTILGVLMIALIPKLKDMQSIARDGQRKVDIKNIAAGLMLYRNDIGKYPTLEDVIPNFQRTYMSSGINIFGNNWYNNSFDGYWNPIGGSNTPLSGGQYYSNIYETVYTTPLGNIYYKSISSQTYYITSNGSWYPYSNTSINLYDTLLKKYLTTIPKDPQNNTTPSLFVVGTMGIGFDGWLTDSLYDGSYQYTTLSHNGSKEQAFALMSTVENINSANRLIGGVNVNIENIFKSNGADLEYSGGISNGYTQEGETNLFSLQSINPYLSVSDVSKNLCKRVERISREPLPINNSWLTNNGGGNIVLGGRNDGVCYINTYYLDTNYTYNNWGFYTLSLNGYFNLTDGNNTYPIMDKKMIETLYYRYLYIQSNN